MHKITITYDYFLFKWHPNALKIITSDVVSSFWSVYTSTLSDSCQTRGPTAAPFLGQRWNREAAPLIMSHLIT